ncbi:MAG: recombinase family protein [Nocardioidaceae bacterium]
MGTTSTATGTARGQVIGYARVSTPEQSLERQYAALGDVDRTFTDQVSGKSREPRRGLTDLLGYVRAGDTVRAASMDRLARSLFDLLDIVRGLTGEGVRVEFVKESLTFSPDEADPTATFQLQMLGAVAELERALIAERRAEGIAIAKVKGKYHGRKPGLTPDEAAEVRRRASEGESKSSIARAFGVGRSTLYRAINETDTYAA